ncbi:condensation domain-containing protein [Neotabrizicola sp. sgz301269]|uniref:condensation domain-containing protein n=1 Tax=Neotabrizicola sp. sgz301269 TaxID=3276282 RepID=UPI00376F87E2
MTQTVDLLNDLAAQGICLTLDGDRISVSGPATALGPAMRERLKAAREDLVILLQDQSAAVAPTTLTLAQAALLPLARSFRDDARYHVPLVVEVEGTIDLFRLIEAQNILQDRHDALRQCFPLDQDAPELRPRGARLGLDAVLELDREAADGALRTFVGRSFDLEQGPLWRALAIQLRPDRFLLAWVFHHLIFDGFSRDVFLGELAAIDRELSQGAAPARTSGAWQIGDVGRWERGQSSPSRQAMALNWWRGHLEGRQTATALPLSRRDCDPEASRSHAFAIAPELASGLRADARALGIPMGAIAIAAVARAMGAATGQSRIVVTTPVLNRDHPQSAGTIGYLNRVLAISVPTQPGNAAEIGRLLLAANDHRHVPGAELAKLAAVPLNRLMVGWQERGPAGLLQGQALRPVFVARAQSDFDLAVNFEAQGPDLACRIDWAEGVFDPDQARAFAALLQSALRGIDMLAGPDLSALLAAAESLPAVAAAAGHTDNRSGVTTLWLELDEFHPVARPALLTALAGSAAKVLPAIRFVTCAALPRRADGSVDLDRLRVEHPAARPGAVPPETALQRAIAAIWQRLLMAETPVGIDDDFRDLGGHSLLAVRMLTEVAALAGRKSPSVAMASARTIRTLAETVTAPESVHLSNGLDPEILARLRSFTGIWQGTRHSSDALIVGRNADGPRLPLFWCLQSERELDALARYLGADQPVYGMRSGYEVMIKSPENIERLALVYAGEIAEIHPKGPLFIGGNCQAAVIAFSLARQLRAAGRQVDLLHLHEKMVPTSYDGRIALTFGRDSDRNPYLAGGDPAADFARYYTGELSVELVSGSHGIYFQEPHVLDLTGAIKRLRDAVPSLRKE